MSFIAQDLHDLTERIKQVRSAEEKLERLSGPGQIPKRLAVRLAEVQLDDARLALAREYPKIERVVDALRSLTETGADSAAMPELASEAEIERLRKML